MKLLYFTAKWCAPCQRFGPLLTKEAGDRGLELVRVDIDELPDAAAAFSVMSVPTVIALSTGGKILDRFGYLTPQKLREKLDSLT